MRKDAYPVQTGFDESHSAEFHKEKRKPYEIHVSDFPDEGRLETEKLFGDGLPERRQQRIELTGRSGGRSRTDTPDAISKLLIYTPSTYPIYYLFFPYLRVRKWCPMSPYEAGLESDSRPLAVPMVSLNEQRSYWQFL